MAERTIADWLIALGLGQYAASFEREQVDMAVLSELTEADLEKLGLPLGVRKRILKALSDQRRDASAAASPRIERRQLTVMFCDLVGSTELSHRLDPEELRRLIRAYQDACVGAIARFDGHVAQYLGDGVLAYFGYPKAREDAAENAVRAGLAAIEQVRGIAGPADQPLSVRIGIDTGLVVIGSGAALAEQERAAIGETPNVAARLQSIAAPSSVVISDRTRRLVGDIFRFEELGDVPLKGVPDPVHALRVIEIRSDAARFDLLRGANLPPLVGREPELSTLRAAWQRASGGGVELVLIQGEPGIGKSRLIRALRDDCAKGGAGIWAMQCSPYFVNTALHPVLTHLDALFGLGGEDSPASCVSRMTQILKARWQTPDLDVKLLGHLMGLPVNESLGGPAMSPQKQRDEAVRALHDLLRVASSEQPLLLVIEDVHWSDPSTLDLIDRVLQRPDSRILLALTFRPEFQPRWLDSPRSTRLSLERLDAVQTEAIATGIAGKVQIAPEILSEIVSRTDGVPLFIEELTKAVLESETAQQGTKAYRLSGGFAASDVPGTLRDSLLARLDHLGRAKEFAQVAACIGREFTDELLSLVLQGNQEDLDTAMTRLVDAGLLFRASGPSGHRYAFKHALVQDAAYDSLLRSDRAEHHQRIAEVLESRFPRIAASEPEVLAHHFARAGLAAQAISNWSQAGALALQKSAAAEAVGHFQQAVAQVPFLEPGLIRDRVEAELQASLGFALMPVRGWTSSEVRACLERVMDLGRVLPDAPLLSFKAAWGLSGWYLLNGRLSEAETLGKECARVARGFAPDLLIEATGVLGNVLMRQGRFKEAERVLREGLEDYREAVHGSHRFVFGQDPAVFGQFFLSQVVWAQGRAEEGLQIARNAHRLATDLGHPFTQAFGFNAPIWIHVFRSEWDPVLGLSEKMIALCDAQGFPYWACWANLAKGIALANLGQSLEGLKLLESVDGALDGMGSREWVTLRQLLLAKGCLLAGMPDRARQHADLGLQWADDSGEAFQHCELLNLRASLAHLPDEKDDSLALSHLERAVDVARTQGSMAFELICAASLAKLIGEQGDCIRARAILEPVARSLPEGHDSPTFRSALNVLRALG